MYGADNGGAKLHTLEHVSVSADLVSVEGRLFLLLLLSTWFGWVEREPQSLRVWVNLITNCTRGWGWGWEWYVVHPLKEESQ